MFTSRNKHSTFGFNIFLKEWGVPSTLTRTPLKGNLCAYFRTIFGFQLLNEVLKIHKNDCGQVGKWPNCDFTSGRTAVSLFWYARFCRLSTSIMPRPVDVFCAFCTGIKRLNIIFVTSKDCLVRLSK